MIGWLVGKLRRGEGPFWSRAKRAAKALAAAHLPVNAVTRPAFSLLYWLQAATLEAFRQVRKMLWSDPLFRSQCAAVGRGLRIEHLPHIGGRGRIVLGEGVCISGQISIGFNNTRATVPELVIGDGTFIGHRCGFNVAESITVGRHCYLASGTAVMDQDGHPIDWQARREGRPTPPEGIRPVVIEDDVWTGFHVLIMKGVRIGARSVVAAGSVVAKDIPPDSIAAGNPARVVRRLGMAEAPADA